MATRTDNPEGKTKFGMGAQGHYRTMPTSEIAALGAYVQAVAAPDAYLAMWVLESMPEDVKPVLDAWGFEQVCTLFVFGFTVNKVFDFLEFFHEATR